MTDRPSADGSTPDLALPLVTRRTVLRGAMAVGVAGVVGGLGLAACGGDDERADPGTTNVGGDDGDLVLVSMIDAASSLAAGSEARLALGLGDVRGTLVLDAPESLTVDIVDTADMTTVASGLEVARHDAGLPRAYFPLIATLDAPSFYQATSEVDGKPIDAAFQVVAPEEITIPRPGQPFPSIVTPTTADAAGVDPICTQNPPCPLHEAELTAVLGQEPVALLVSTPAFCQTAICGPVLDIFVAAQDEAPDVTFIHAEVYASAEAVEAEGLSAQLAPAVEALELPFEPALFLIDANGTLVRRIDVIYDEVELRDGLAQLTT